MELLSADALVAELRGATDPERRGWVTVALEEGMPAPPELPVARLASLPYVVVGLLRGAIDPGWLDLCDVAVDDGDPSLAWIRENLETRPVACAALALLLRGQPRRSLDDGLVAESAVYSVLQAGTEFAAWRSEHPPRPDAGSGDGARVRARRDGDALTVTLTRPEKLNALDAKIRDELTEALDVAALDPDVARVELRGEGGRSAPAATWTSSVLGPTRLRRTWSGCSAVSGRTLARLGKPVVAHVHGATFGSGIELAAFASAVRAAPDTQIALPEVGLGLVPGAGAQ